MKAVLFVARHAPTPGAASICIGQWDGPCSRDPGAIAEALRGSWSGTREVGRVWSSPLRRCSEVAKALAAAWGVPHLVDRRLLEISYGLWEGRPWKEIEREDPRVLQEWMRDWERRGPPGGESALAVEARVRSWWESLEDDPDEVLIAHAGVIRALKVLIGECRWNEAMQTPIRHLKWMRFEKPTRGGCPRTRTPPL